MIKSNSDDKSVISVNLEKEYFIPSDINSILISSLQICEDCKMTRIAMSCYAAAKHQCSDKDNKVARVMSKGKPAERKYAETEATISLDKYNGKLMNSIWGLYNRNSPHNFKSLNQEDQVKMMTFEQGNASTFKKASLVQFSIPNFGIAAGLETKIEVNKPKITLEKLENIFNSPPFH